MRGLLAAQCFVILLIITGCKTTKVPAFPTGIVRSSSYAELYNWAAHPWKSDPSDSIPEGIIDRKKDSVADVFFIYPTTYTKQQIDGINAKLDNDALNYKTDNASILYQASVFNQHCRVFAPRFRQAHYSIFYDFESVKSKTALDTAYEDIRAAFKYYLQNFHNKLPLIIAAHSQGTIHAARLIREFIDDKPLEKYFVCAYLLGMPVPENQFKNIGVCKDSTQTGCFVSWRTFKRGYIPGYIEKEPSNIAVVNPLTWKTDDTYASSKLNAGGVLKNFNKIYPGVVDAEVHGNVLWSSKPKFFGNILLTTKNYHIADINLFYVNIRRNVEVRLKNFRP